MENTAVASSVDGYIAGFPPETQRLLHELHVGLYPMVGAAADELEDELRPYRYGKGTVRFALEEPLPADLIRRIILARAGEIERKTET